MWDRDDRASHVRRVLAVAGAIVPTPDEYLAVAVLTVGGWFDAEDMMGPLRVYRAIEAITTPGVTNSLVMGPWAHGGWGSARRPAAGQRSDLPLRTRQSTTGENIVLPFFESPSEADMDDPTAAARRTCSKWAPPTSGVLHSAWPPLGGDAADAVLPRRAAGSRLRPAGGGGRERCLGERSCVNRCPVLGYTARQRCRGRIHGRGSALRGDPT